MRDFDPTASEFISSGYLERSRPGGVLYDIGTIIGVGSSLLGGVMGADATESAADSQAAASDRATQAQKEMFNKQVELQAPFRDAGLSANNRLMYLLGLGGNETPMSSDDRYNQLLQSAEADHKARYGVGLDGADQGAVAQWKDEMQQRAQRETQGLSTVQPGEYGSLMKNFSMADFEADPGYAFRMSEGTKAIEGGAAARGGLLSGAAQKALQKYGQESASQEYGNAFNRFTGQQTNQYNRLAGIVNTGQGATNQVSNAAGQFGQQQASNIIGAGNAQAAGQIGGANALVGGINGAINGYQNNQLMNMIRNPSAGSTAMRPASSEAYYGY